MQTEALDIDTLEAGIELDALIITKVMNWPIMTWDQGVEQEQYPWAWLSEQYDNDAYHIFMSPDEDAIDFSPSTDIAAAWRVVGALTARGYSVVTQILSPKGPQSARIYGVGDQYVGIAYAPNMPLAICRAALKAAS